MAKYSKDEAWDIIKNGDLWLKVKREGILHILDEQGLRGLVASPDVTWAELCDSLHLLIKYLDLLHLRETWGAQYWHSYAPYRIYLCSQQNLILETFGVDSADAYSLIDWYLREHELHEPDLDDAGLAPSLEYDRIPTPADSAWATTYMQITLWLGLTHSNAGCFDVKWDKPTSDPDATRLRQKPTGPLETILNWLVQKVLVPGKLKIKVAVHPSDDPSESKYSVRFENKQVPVDYFVKLSVKKSVKSGQHFNDLRQLIQRLISMIQKLPVVSRGDRAHTHFWQ